MLDGLAMAIPTGDIRGVVPPLGMGFIHEILKDLIEGMPDMDGTVRIGRPIMQDKGRSLGILLQHLPIQPIRLPCL